MLKLRLGRLSRPSAAATRFGVDALQALGATAGADGGCCVAAQVLGAAGDAGERDPAICRGGLLAH